MANSIDLIIPAYNAAAYLVEAFESVVEQKWPVWKIFLVDDGSEDSTLSIARGLPHLQCLEQSHLGTGAARNRGIREAQGDLLLCLDADDLLAPGAFSSLFRVLEENPEVDGVFGHMVEFFSADLAPAQRARFEIRTEPRPGSIGALLIRRESFLKAGYFREDLVAGETIDWLSRAQEAGLRFITIPEVTLYRRIHLNNSTHQNSKKAHDYLTVVRDRLKRVRSHILP